MNAQVVLLSGLVLMSLGGCYEDIKVTIKEPHIYKGKTDPHEVDASTRAELLSARFKAGQLDR
jgi:hypothetical protein